MSSVRAADRDGGRTGPVGRWTNWCAAGVLFRLNACLPRALPQEYRPRRFPLDDAEWRAWLKDPLP